MFYVFIIALISYTVKKFLNFIHYKLRKIFIYDYINVKIKNKAAKIKNNIIPMILS